MGRRTARCARLWTDPGRNGARPNTPPVRWPPAAQEADNLQRNHGWTGIAFPFTRAVGWKEKLMGLSTSRRSASSLVKFLVSSFPGVRPHFSIKDSIASGSTWRQKSTTKAFPQEYTPGTTQWLPANQTPRKRAAGSLAVPGGCDPKSLPER